LLIKVIPRVAVIRLNRLLFDTLSRKEENPVQLDELLTIQGVDIKENMLCL
jgi:hypothetical protein